MTSKIFGPIVSQHYETVDSAEARKSPLAKSGWAQYPKNHHEMPPTYHSPPSYFRSLEALDWNAQSTRQKTMEEKPTKNYIRENIRRLRQLQQNVSQQRLVNGSNQHGLYQARFVIPTTPHIRLTIPTERATFVPAVRPNVAERSKAVDRLLQNEQTYISRAPVKPPLFEQDDRKVTLTSTCDSDASPVEEVETAVHQNGGDIGLNTVVPEVEHCSRAVQCDNKSNSPPPGISPLVKPISRAVQTAQSGRCISPSRPATAFAVAKRSTESPRPQSAHKHSIRCGTAVDRNSRPSSVGQDFLKAHEKTGVAVPEMIALSNRPLTPINRRTKRGKLTVPRAAMCRDVQLIRRDINFLRANAHMVSMPVYSTSRLMRRSPSLQGQGGKSGNSDSKPDTSSRPGSAVGSDAAAGEDKQRQRRSTGYLPAYLVKQRKAEAKRAVDEACNIKDPDQPPGHRRMPDDERLQTLDMLQKAYGELLCEMGKLPMRMDTLRAQNRRAELEKRLSELEQAIAIFSKPKVFIGPD